MIQKYVHLKLKTLTQLYIQLVEPTTTCHLLLPQILIFFLVILLLQLSFRLIIAALNTLGAKLNFFLMLNQKQGQSHFTLNIATITNVPWSSAQLELVGWFSSEDPVGLSREVSVGGWLSREVSVGGWLSPEVFFGGWLSPEVFVGGGTVKHLVFSKSFRIRVFPYN